MYSTQRTNIVLHDSITNFIVLICTNNKPKVLRLFECINITMTCSLDAAELRGGIILVQF